MKMMDSKERELFCAVIVTSVVAGLASSCSHGAQSLPLLLEPVIRPLDAESDSYLKPCCFPAIFSFGSSVADTGTGVILRVDSPAGNYPYGITFPGKPSGRWSDGRLLIDFWADALGLPYLDPFIKSGTSSFRQGANFASAGCTATNKYTSSSPSCFDLALQLYQFRHFKSQVLAADRDRAQTNSRRKQVQDCVLPLPSESVFPNALYVIAAGANDIMYPVLKRTPVEEMRAAIPYVSAAIMHVVQGLYEEGARNILVENVYPLGCLPYALALNLTVYGDLGAVDSDGCVKLISDFVSMLNSLLKKEITAFARAHPLDFSIALVDTHSIRRDLMTRPVKYGFKHGVQPCCGVEGIPGRYSDDAKCGQSPKAQPCSDPSEYVLWDGLHYTEAANLATMNELLSGQHFHPKASLNCSTVCMHLLPANLAR